MIFWNIRFRKQISSSGSQLREFCVIRYEGSAYIRILWRPQKHILTTPGAHRHRWPSHWVAGRHPLHHEGAGRLNGVHHGYTTRALRLRWRRRSSCSRTARRSGWTARWWSACVLPCLTPLRSKSSRPRRWPPSSMCPTDLSRRGSMYRRLRRWRVDAPESRDSAFWGSRAWAIKPKKQQRKLEQKTAVRRFVRYTVGGKAYRILEDVTNQVFERRDVLMEENPAKVETWAAGSSAGPRLTAAYDGVKDAATEGAMDMLGAECGREGEYSSDDTSDSDNEFSPPSPTAMPHPPLPRRRQCGKQESVVA